MKRIMSILLLSLTSVALYSQKMHKLNLSFDGSLGLYYFNSRVDNPIAYAGNFGYQYDVNYFLGVEVGVRVGGFHQGVKYRADAPSTGNNSQTPFTKDVYKGWLIGPYIAPKIFIPVGFHERAGRATYMYLENKFSYIHTTVSTSKISEEVAGRIGNRFTYEFKLGYQYPIDARWAVHGWIGYNTYDFSKVSKNLRYKNSTPFEMGVGVSFLLKKISNLKHLAK